MGKESQIAIEILKALNSCEPYAMPEETLFTQVGILVPGRVLRSEFESALKRLEAQRCITGAEASFGRGVRWMITADGKAQVAGL